MEKLLTLPWYIQAVIVAGYCGYVVAYSGRRRGHTSTDTISLILAFGGIALADLYTLGVSLNKNVWLNVAATIHAFLITIALALLWRCWGKAKAQWVLGKLGSNREDGLLGAWDSVVQDDSLCINQLNVRLKDGRILESFPLTKFKDWPSGACLLGSDGSVGLYVTHIEESGERRESRGLIADEGARFTIVPIDQIQEVDLRLTNR